MTRLGHCTPTLGGHSPACVRDGTYCGQVSTHTGPCTPHLLRSRCRRPVCGEYHDQHGTHVPNPYGRPSIRDEYAGDVPDREYDDANASS